MHATQEIPPVQAPRGPGLAFRRGMSRTAGWLADRRLPGPLRRLVYRVYCAFTGARAGEAELDLKHYPSLGAFFVRRLRPGARPIDADPATLISPCDGTLQATGRVSAGTLLQAKGQSYRVDELLGGLATAEELEGARAVTVYLSPRDYHRVHAPLAARLVRTAWIGHERFSVAPSVLLRRPRVFVRNERCVLALEADAPHRFTFYLVMVGALNVGRIRVVGVPPGTSPPAPVRFERGAELARFEMGSTVVLVLPPGVADAPEEGRTAWRLGEPLLRLPART